MLLSIPFLISSYMVLSGSIPFWYDPARDFLLAWDNLSKVTLIGPTTGIPGIFYGPYWVWFISLGLLFSKDPRVPIMLVQTIPYTLIIPFFFIRQKDFSRISLLAVWLLFMVGYGINYAAMPWNPQIAPIFLILLFFIISRTEAISLDSKQYKNALLLGICLGLLMNVHISFGLATVLGTAIYFLFCFVSTDIRLKKRSLLWQSFKRQALFSTCAIGAFLLTFAPFFLFEIRHNFLQTKSIVTTLLSDYAVVGIKGLTKPDIVDQFIDRLVEFLSLPHAIAIAVVLVLGIVFIKRDKKQTFFSRRGKRIFFYALAILLSSLAIYLTSKNPIWAYHFIGVDVLFMFIVMVLIEKSKIIQWLFFVWMIYVLGTFAVTFASGLNQDVLRLTDLKSKEVITQIIRDDAGARDYTVYPYNPAIYSYEYAYLFRSLAHKEVPYDPGQTPIGSKLSYVLVTSLSDPLQQDFINFRTNNKRYVTTQIWTRPDGTLIIRRELKK